MVRDAQAYFSSKAEAYRQSASHGNAVDLDRMVSWLAPHAGERALDIATGGGHTALALARAGCDTLATDATPAMLKDWPPLPRVVCDAERLPFCDETFDIVATRIAPHHFDLTRFAREAARVLRPGGRLYAFDLTTPEDARQAETIDRAERLRDPSHRHSHAPSEWRAALADAGLRVARLETSTSALDVGAWIARARMPPHAERELRELLSRHPPYALSGYGIGPDGRMTVLRIEVLATS